MKNLDILLQKYAKLIVEVGANVQKDQRVVVSCSTDNNKFARLVTKEAYNVGAKEVIINWYDDEVSLLDVLNQSVETYSEVPNHLVERYRYFVSENVCFIHITSEVPGIFKDADSEKLMASRIARHEKLHFYNDHVMSNGTQWTIGAVPNPVWAKKVFPNVKNDEEAVSLLWDAILKASRVTTDKDPVLEWKNHNQELSNHTKLLNDYNFKYLHFKNSLGTDLTVELVKNHIWLGGAEKSSKGVIFNANIPTEEVFTMPYKYGTQGKVVATKPLNYEGKLIEDFYLVFKDGKVVEYDAKNEKVALESLLNTDEGSKYIGEIALISHDSPISNMNILFYETLFDENASCHMALGKAYPINIKNGPNMEMEELEALGYNNSINHVDFMFGSHDMEIVGEKESGEKVEIFKKGNFVI
jgi:aminopeptidase